VPLKQPIKRKVEQVRQKERDSKKREKLKIKLESTTCTTATCCPEKSCQLASFSQAGKEF
jgi:hypothetical protein